MSSAFATIVFGLAASLCWGSGDFNGGLASRRANASSVVIAAYAVGFVLLVVLALIWKEPFPAPLDITWGGLAGLAGAIGLIAFYSALSIGRMGIAAPISAVLTAGLPVIFSAFTEGLPGLLQLGGFLLALLAIRDLLAPGGCTLHLSTLFAHRSTHSSAADAAQVVGCPSRLARGNTGRLRQCIFRSCNAYRPARCRSRSCFPVSRGDGNVGRPPLTRTCDAHTGGWHSSGAGGGSIDLGVSVQDHGIRNHYVSRFIRQVRLQSVAQASLSLPAA